MLQREGMNMKEEGFVILQRQKRSLCGQKQLSLLEVHTYEFIVQLPIYK